MIVKKTKDINLLPESESTKSVIKVFPILLVFSVVVILVLLLGIGTLFLKISVNNELSKLDSQLSDKNSQWEKIASSAASLSQIKTKISSYQTFVATSQKTDEYLKKIKSSLIEGAGLKSLNIDNKGAVGLQIELDNPKDAYQLVNVFSAEKNFQNVKILSTTKGEESGKYVINMTLTVKP